MYIRSAPPGRIIYEIQCRHFLFEKLGAVVFWDKCNDTPGGHPHIQFWKRRLAKCFVYPPQRASLFFPFIFKWKGYNRGRRRNRILNNSRWY